VKNKSVKIATINLKKKTSLLHPGLLYRPVPPPPVSLAGVVKSGKPNIYIIFK
jgi:hypothetical protein